MRKIHPNPIVNEIKVLLLMIFLSALFIYLRGLANLLNDPLMIGMWIVGIFYMLYLMIAARFISLEIGENDILFKRGILNIKTGLVPYKKITDARYAQTIVERLFSVGTLEIDTAGSDTVSVYMRGVPFRDLERIITIIRSKRGDEPHEE
jgi:uncharacterized membrane protein YdbT with pleckstrin-like domain